MKNTTSILIVICLSQGKTQYKSSLSFKRSDKRKIAIALAADDKMVAITILLGIIPLAKECSRMEGTLDFDSFDLGANF